MTRDDVGGMSVDTLFADLISRERCSEADYDRATDLIASGAKSEADIIAEWTPLALELGAEVTFKDLKGRADLNGLSGTVVSFVRATGRFGVKAAGGEANGVGSGERCAVGKRAARREREQREGRGPGGSGRVRET